MANIELTVKQIMNLGLWEKVCEYKGWETYIVNEGGISVDDLVEFDDEFKKEEDKAVDKVYFYTEENLKQVIDEDIEYMDEDDLKQMVLNFANTLLYHEKVINRLSNEWERYVDYQGQDGHDANIVMGIIKELKGGEKFE